MAYAKIPGFEEIRRQVYGMRADGKAWGGDSRRPHQAQENHPHLSLDLNNLQILCDEDNHGKGN